MPSPGDQCSSKEFWSEIPVKNTTKDPLAKPTFTRVKDSRKADRFVCIPFGWNPESGIDFKAPFGEWNLERYPLRVKWDPELYKPNSEHDPCRIAPTEQPKQTLASYDRVANGFIPSVGRVRGLMVSLASREGFERDLEEISVRAGTRPVEVLKRWWRDSAEIATYAEDYYWNQSRGRMNLSIKVDEKFHFVDPAPLFDGVSPDVAGIVSAIDADGVDFTGVDFVIFQIPGYARDRAFSASYPVTVDGQLIQNSHTLSRPFSIQSNPSGSKWTLVHEIGHLLGLPDLYAETHLVDNGYANRFALNHSIMNSNSDKGFTGYERWLLGWMPTKNVRCVLPTDGYATTIGMSTVDSADNYGFKLVMFPIAGDSDRLRVMELRGWSSGFQEPGIFVYEVFGPSSSARFTGLTNDLFPTNPSTLRAPITAYRDDWTTLERTEPRPTDNQAEALLWNETYNNVTSAAKEQSVRQESESPFLVWDDGQVLALHDLEFQRNWTRATLRYGFGQ